MGPHAFPSENTYRHNKVTNRRNMNNGIVTNALECITINRFNSKRGKMQCAIFLVQLTMTNE
jgi:hypothetical protein